MFAASINVFHAGNPHVSWKKTWEKRRQGVWLARSKSDVPAFCMVSVLASTKVESYLATNQFGDRGPVGQCS